MLIYGIWWWVVVLALLSLLLSVPLPLLLVLIHLMILMLLSLPYFRKGLLCPVAASLIIKVGVVAGSLPLLL